MTDINDVTREELIELIKVCSSQFIFGRFVVEIRNREKFLWVIKNNNFILNKDMEWEYEPLPSSRTQKQIKRTRFKLFNALEIAHNLSVGIKQCKPCGNKRVLSGQAFCKYTCEHCEKQYDHPNTRVPMYCFACAVKLGICQRCGGNEF